MPDLNEIKAFAEKQGFTDVKELGQYDGNTVYLPVFADSKVRKVGYPQYILVSGEHISLRIDSSFELTDKFFPD